MRIPFDSLDPVQWLAWSDFSRDQGRERAADWGQRVGESLQKMAAVGCDPRMVLTIYSKDPEIENSHLSPCMFCSELFKSADWYEDIKKHCVTRFRFHYPSAQWRTFRQCQRLCRGSADTLIRLMDHKDRLSITPSSFLDPWKHHRLSAKFFSTVVMRARGIR